MGYDFATVSAFSSWSVLAGLIVTMCLELWLDLLLVYMASLGKLSEDGTSVINAMSLHCLGDESGLFMNIYNISEEAIAHCHRNNMKICCTSWVLPKIGVGPPNHPF